MTKWISIDINRGGGVPLSEIVYSTTMAGTLDHTNSSANKRRLQQVCTKSQKRICINWMIDEVLSSGTETKITTKAEEQFPQLFRQCHKANRQRARRWYDARHAFLEALQTEENKALSITSARTSGIGAKRVPLKCLSGRGRKREDWVEYLHSMLLVDFERLTELKVQIIPEDLRTLAIKFLQEPDSPFTDTEHNASGKLLRDCVTREWIYGFQRRFNIVRRKQSGALARSELHTMKTEQEIAYFLGNIKRQFDNGTLLPESVENMDETHFVVDMKTCHTLGFTGQKKVNFTDVVSGGEGMTLVLRITGGINGKIEAPFMIFRNDHCSYPIKGVPDNIEGVSYRTGRSGWMDSRVFNLWLREPKVIGADSEGRTRILYCDNCSGHQLKPETVASLAEIKTELRKLPANATHLIQPLDSFIIMVIKNVWRGIWRERKLQMQLENQFSNQARGSGKIRNPGKSYFLELAKKTIDIVNSRRTEDGISYARKGMIQCGLNPDIDGVWKVSQLSSELQRIVIDYDFQFQGNNPDHWAPEN